MAIWKRSKLGASYTLICGITGKELAQVEPTRDGFRVTVMGSRLYPSIWCTSSNDFADIQTARACAVIAVKSTLRSFLGDLLTDLDKIEYRQEK